MNIEERLRDAFEAAAGTVPPEAIRACPDPPRRRRRLDMPLYGWRRRALVPVATAVAVAVIVVGASIAASQLLTGNHHRGPNTPYGQLTVGAPYRGLPRYFITSAGDTSPLTVRDTSTGSITGRLAPPHGMFFPAVAAAADDRTFVVAVEPTSGRCAAGLYRIQLDSRGRPGGLVPLGITVPGTFSTDGGLALTPDGRIAAYTTYHCGQGNGEIGIINLRTHQVRKWSWAIPEDQAGLSLTADGRLLSFTDVLLARTTPPPGPIMGIPVTRPVTVELATDALPGATLERGHVVLRSAGAQAISSDGTKLYACTESPAARPAVPGTLGQKRNQTFTVTLRAYDARTGQPLSVLHRWPNQATDYCQLSRNASGSFLLIRLPAGLVWWNIAGNTAGPLLPATGLPFGEPISALSW
jgi:hypothetical protein